MAGVIDHRNHGERGEEEENEFLASIDAYWEAERERYRTKASVISHEWARIIRYTMAEKVYQGGRPKYGYVYLMADISRTVYKIGQSIDPKKRLKQIQRKTPFTLELIHAVPSSNARAVECHFHYKLFDDCISGEWFELPDGFVEKFCEVDFFDWRGV